MTESFRSQATGPEDSEVFRIELPDSAYHGEIPERVENQYIDSYGPKGRGWKLVAGSAIIITLAGVEYFRRKYGNEE
jgi:hypothetical protein